MDHYFKTIPGWATFRELYAEMVKRAPADQPSHFVEIGSWFGRSAAFIGVEIINSGKPIKVDCIDPWTDGGPDLKHKGAKFKSPDELFECFKLNVRPVQSVINPVRLSSLDAAPTYLDNSLDFVFIDGDHSYEACRDDIKAWLPKVKHGGIIAGDDHTWAGVRKAVKEALPHRHVEIRQVTARDKGSLKKFEYWVCEL